MIKIAEIGINFDGDFKLLESMIKQAKKAGADGIKIQYLKPNRMYPGDAIYKLPEGKKNINNYLKSYQLTIEDIKKIRELTKSLNLLFGCTVVDVKSVQPLRDHIDFFKVASSELNFMQLHQEIASTGLDCVVSTGGATFEEVKRMTKYYRPQQLTVLYCNYEYPTNLENVNLDKLNIFSGLGVKYGFSNHTKDFEVIGPMCVSLGCDYFEAHVTEERKNKGDHFFSLTFDEFKKMCDNINMAEKIIGDKLYALSEKELELRNFCYRKAFAKNDIPSASRIKKEDITWLRNSGKEGKGFDPPEEYLIINHITKHAIKKGEKIGREDLF